MIELTKAQLASLVDVAKQNPEWALRQAFRFGAVAGKSEEAQAAIKRAAEMLDFDAESIKQAYDNSWTSEEKADYDERKKVANKLRAMCAEMR